MAWRTKMTWSERLPKINVGCLSDVSVNVIGNSLGLVQTRGKANRS